jgi:hypothetical protein
MASGDEISWVVPFSFLSGVGLMILSTGNRLHNVNGLIRGFARERPIMERERVYLKLLLRRSRFLHRALTMLYVSMGLFSVAALAGNLSQNWAWAAGAAGATLADGLTALGVGGVVLCAAQLIVESALSYRVIRYYEHYRHHGGGA